jgi:glycine betaine/proline transport system substrate-binding protein
LGGVMMKKLLIASAVAAGTILGVSGQASAACGTVSIAEMNWASAQLLANVDKIILSKGYGCDVNIVPGDTMPTFTSMNEKGVPDVAGEMWINAVAVPLEKAKAEGRLHTVSDPITGLGEGWWLLPHTMEKHPELKTVQDILKRPDLFPHPEDPSKGGFHTCPSGWGCQLANANLFRAFEMEKKGWRLVDPGSAAGLDASIAKASDRKENWFGYYWSPTSIVGKYSLNMMDFGIPFAGKDNWDNCIVKSEQDCSDPKPSAWTKSEVNTVISDDFKKRAGSEVSDYFGKRIFPGPIMNATLSFMADQQATGEDAAIEFLTKHENIWTNWVSSDAAKKIKAGL